MGLTHDWFTSKRYRDFSHVEGCDFFDKVEGGMLNLFAWSFINTLFAFASGHCSIAAINSLLFSVFEKLDLYFPRLDETGFILTGEVGGDNDDQKLPFADIVAKKADMHRKSWAHYLGDCKAPDTMLQEF